MNIYTDNLINFPSINTGIIKKSESIPTPKSDKIFERAEKLSKISNYPCDFDFEAYKKLELRFGLEQPRGGVIFNSPFKLVNSHNTCQQCPLCF